MFGNLIAPKYEGVCNVQKNFTTYFNLLVNKVSSLFIWKNLPETIDKRFLEFQLLLAGKVCFTEFNGKLYCLNGSVGGEPNVYYEPCYWIVANPVLGSKQVKIRNKDGSSSIDTLEGILVANSDVDYENLGLKGGLYSLIYQTAGLLADNISSLNIAQINSRLSAIFTASDEAIARTGEEVLKEIYNGRPYKILREEIVDKINVNPIASSGQNNTLMSLIEAKQYIIAQFLQEIGISANYNMKRERLNTAEVEMNNGALDINIFNMIKNRQEGAALVNEKWGTNIEVELNWAVFNEENGNADAEKDDEPTEEEEAAGAGVSEGEDDDLQVEGVKEDTIEEESPEENKMEEVIEEEIEKEDEGE